MNEGLAGRVGNLEETVYRGNGRPSLLARMEVAEKRQDSVEETQDKWEGIAQKLLVGSILLVVGELVRIGLSFVHH